MNGAFGRRSVCLTFSQGGMHRWIGWLSQAVGDIADILFDPGRVKSLPKIRNSNACLPGKMIC